jgi:hypothetical protein
MKVIVPVELKAWTSSLAEPDAGAGWSAYSGATTYSEGMRATSGGRVYQSLKNLNLNNPLPVSPILNTVWWNEVTETAYAIGTTYAVGAIVVDAGTHRIYQSLQAANLGKPLPVYPETTTAWWADIGVTNKYACFDASRNTQSIGVNTLTLTITPGVRINSLAVMGTDCDSLTISLSTGGIGYPKTVNMLSKYALNYYQYFFNPFAYERSSISFDIPPSSTLVITLTFTKASGPIRVGSIIPGNYVYLGRTQYNAVSDAINFSVVNRDLYGNATLVPRRSVPKTNQTLRVAKTNVDLVRAARSSLNAVPAVWCGLDDLDADDYYESILIVGVYKTFSINLAFPDEAEVSLELEEI